MLSKFWNLYSGWFYTKWIWLDCLNVTCLLVQHTECCKANIAYGFRHFYLCHGCYVCVCVWKVRKINQLDYDSMYTNWWSTKTNTNKIMQLPFWAGCYSENKRPEKKTTTERRNMAFEIYTYILNMQQSVSNCKIYMWIRWFIEHQNLRACILSLLSHIRMKKKWSKFGIMTMKLSQSNSKSKCIIVRITSLSYYVKTAPGESGAWIQFIYSSRTSTPDTRWWFMCFSGCK